MSITIQKYKQSDIEVWDKFIKQSNNGTLFHTQKFLSYHPTDRFLDNSLIFQKKGNIISVLSAAIKKEKGKKGKDSMVDDVTGTVVSKYPNYTVRDPKS